jgi:hypothetical protein
MPEQEMYDCPYAPGLQCNQRRIMCDKGHFDGHCLLAILGNMSRQQQLNIKAIEREAMEDAVVFLFDSDYIRSKYYDLSPDDIVKIILDERKQERIATRPTTKPDKYYVNMHEGDDTVIIDINNLDPMFLHEDIKDAIEACDKYQANITEEESKCGFRFHVIDLETGKSVYWAK